METANWLEWPSAAETSSPGNQPCIDPDGAHALAQAIVDTIREPLLVLDKDLRVVTANRSFCSTFSMKCQDVLGRSFYALGDGHGPRLVRRYKRTATNVSANSLAIHLRHERA